MASWADIVEGGNAAVVPHKHMEPIVENIGEEEEKYDLSQKIATLRNSIKAVCEAVENAGSEIELEELNDEYDSLSEMLNFANWQLGNIMGYDTLAEMRRIWGTESDKHNKLQEKYYKLQKARYEHCKRVKNFFSAEDRAYISHYKALNEEHLAMREVASECREMFQDIIEVAFPDAPFDLGWDEVWRSEAIHA